MTRYVYSTKDYFNMLQLYFKNCEQESPAAAAYKVIYPGRGKPCANVITSLVDRLLYTGQMMPIYGGGAPRTTRTVKNTEAILKYFETETDASVGDAERKLGIGHTTVHRVLQEEVEEENLCNVIKTPPIYRYKRVQCLRGNDAARRLNFCRSFIERTEADVNYTKRILWTDDASFTREGMYSTHSYDLWSHENPYQLRNKTFSEEWTINVWAGLLDNQLIGPVYLPSRMNADMYLEFLQNQLPGLIHPIDVDIDDLPLIRRNIIYQHDGAPAHFQNNVRTYLDQIFPNRWIGRGGPTPWPSRSHDLTPVDFFLWEAIKTRVYHTKVRSQEECMERLEDAFEFYRQHPEMIRNATTSVVNRAKKCVVEDGHRFQHLLC